MKSHYLCWLFLFASAAANSAPKWMTVTSDNDWSRANTYVYMSVTFVIACEPGRRCEAGTGLFLGGKPRGSRRAFTGTIRMTAFGAGSLYVRAGDGQGKVQVAFYEQNSRLVPLYPPVWEAAAWRVAPTSPAFLTQTEPALRRGCDAGPSVTGTQLRCACKYLAGDAASSDMDGISGAAVVERASMA